MRSSLSVAGVVATTISLVVASAVGAEAVEKDGGYRACPAGKKISVQATYALNEGKSIRVRIYATPSKRTKKDVTMILSEQGRHITTVPGRIRVGYWSVQSVQGDEFSINDSNTKARCV